MSGSRGENTASHRAAYSGAFASTRGTLDMPRWKLITCPRESCGAGPGTSCRRWAREFSTLADPDAGHWVRLKNPHRERQAATRNPR